MPVSVGQLVQAGVHFGHLRSRWNPKMEPYIWGHRNNIHLIDVCKTAFKLEEAARFLETVAREGKQILWVGTKRSAQKSIHTAATNLEMPFVTTRWVGGTLSNFAEVKKAIRKSLHLQDIVDKADKVNRHTKAELNVFQKMLNRLEKSIGGIRTLTWPVGAIVIVDVTREVSALKEAYSMKIPVVALVDTNANPDLVDYVIPANDDAAASIDVLISYLEQAAQRGRDATKAASDQAKMQKEPATSAVATPELNAALMSLQEDEADGSKGAGMRKRAKLGANKAESAPSLAEKEQKTSFVKPSLALAKKKR
jgi:small subunit ribosomal protein S2